jgi:hypothetical protein
VSNERIAAAIRLVRTGSRKTGIRERRFLWDFDEDWPRCLSADDGWRCTRRTTPLWRVALRRALMMANRGQRDRRRLPGDLLSRRG